MATSTKPSNRSVDAVEETPKGISQFGINTEIDPISRRLDSQGTVKPMTILTTGTHAVPSHGKRYIGVPSNFGRVEAPEEPRVYGNTEDARSTKRCKRHTQDKQPT
jgi:hypothetical protein